MIEPDVFEEPTLKESIIKMQKEIRPLAIHCLTEIKLKTSSTSKMR